MIVDINIVTPHFGDTCIVHVAWVCASEHLHRERVIADHYTLPVVEWPTELQTRVVEGLRIVKDQASL